MFKMTQFGCIWAMLVSTGGEIAAGTETDLEPRLVLQEFLQKQLAADIIQTTLLNLINNRFNAGCPGQQKATIYK